MKNFCLILTSVVLLGCSPKVMDLKTASNLNTPEAYRSFLFHSESEDERFAARLKLETLLYFQLKQSTGIAPVITFLHEFPKGKHHREAHRLLATRRAERALSSKGVWPLIRFLHYHPRHPMGKQVRKVLEARWFEQLEKTPTITGIRRYLDYFPLGIHFRPAMERLAALELAKLGDNPSPEALSLLSIAYADTKAGARAKAALARMRHLEVLIAGEFHAVAALLLREKNLPGDLVAASLKRHMQRAVLSLDGKTLESLCSLTTHYTCPKQLSLAMKRWKGLSKARHNGLLQMVRKAAPFVPYPSLKTLTVAMNSTDLRTIWIAL
ncbi:hypothetical protein KKF84_07415, partial [Myxococcota bacterium]|nr:hypothetical protein [Myxococcota bacterium]